METLPCPICGLKSFESYIEVPDRFNAAARWKIVRSPSSGFIMLNPRPDASEIAGYYHEGPEGSYDPHLHKCSAASTEARLYLKVRSLLLNRKSSMVLDGAQKAPAECRILEIGCSTGDLLNYLHQKKGIPAENLSGIETDPNAASAAETHSGISIFRNGIHELNRQGTFDRIVFWHALEHLHDLNGILGECSWRLNSDGIMVVALPNPESRDARHYRENWVAWDAPRHLWHFTPATLGTLLERHELEIFRTGFWLPDTLYNCWHSEKLIANLENRTFGLREITETLLQTSLGIASSLFSLRNASSIVYYIRRKERI
ncbi:Methyltransferase type 12 [Chlorobium limicola DSM 245]|uniref:Methyltransferase type 12 n=1 Tax=Chlorobium limicola (strain DSM 245 / NBRC 103803 / 6330) TaxID=290315 RepID=B3EI87_CHLL2|nr:class I SAM-dependent methyltransferase [Chlorobium limicola]ACD89917.1 Methyltransferase type 12 [Chlorobium limicola DSM 245]